MQTQDSLEGHYDTVSKLEKQAKKKQTLKLHSGDVMVTQLGDAI